MSVPRTPLLAPHLAAWKSLNPGMPALVRALGPRACVQLASNENPYGPSPKVQQALIEAAARVHRYPDNQVHALRARLSAYHGVAPEEIAFGPGSSPLIEAITRTFATPEEHAIIGRPSFPAYGLALAAANIPTSVVPLRDEIFWDLPGVLARVQPNTKLVFIDNPVNPTSTHIASRPLREFLRELPEHVIVVVDEAYAEFADAASYESALRMRELRERLLVLRTFSKAYALAGLRVGYAVGQPALTKALELLRDPFIVGSLGQVAALSALDDSAHLQRTLASNASERLRLTAALQSLGLMVAPSQTNFLFVCLPLSAAEAQERLLERGVIVRTLGPELPCHLRVSIGLPEDNDRFLNELRAILA